MTDDEVRRYMKAMLKVIEDGLVDDPVEMIQEAMRRAAIALSEADKAELEVLLKGRPAALH